MMEFEIGYGVDAVLNPKVIAVIGVSNKKEKMDMTGGTAVLRNLLRYGYEGEIYPINPKYDTIMGLKCYPSITAVPKMVDLVVIAIPAECVPETLEECGKVSCRAAIIVSSGFAEIRTEHGNSLQNRIVEIAQKYLIRVLGPNNLGVYNVFDKIVASTSTALFYYDHIKPGGIAWVTQSGALGSTIHSRAADREIGLSYVVTSGNECDLQASDFIWYMLDDPRVHVIGLYIEGIRDWDKFSIAAEKARRMKKPIIVYKAGMTEVGVRAAKAHTGSEAGDIDEYCEFFRKNGVVMVESMDDLYQTAHLLEQWRKFSNISNYAILTISGGEGGTLADGLTFLDINVPQFSLKTYKQIMEIIPSFGSGQNPIDVTAQMMRNPEKLRQIGAVLEDAGEVEAIIYAPTTVAKGNDLQVACDFAEIINNSKKPGVVCWYSSSINAAAIAYLRKKDIPVFTDNESLLRAITTRRQYFNLTQR